MNSSEQPTITPTEPKARPQQGSQEFEDLLSDLYNACAPNETAGQYYFDLSEARGGESVKDNVLRNLRRMRRGTFLRYLFSGHSGGGKSSELRDLEKHLANPDDLTGGKRFFPIYIDADEYFNYDDLALPDLLLAIAAEVGFSLRKSEHKIEVVDSYFHELLRRIRESLFTEYGVEKIEAGITAPIGSPASKGTSSILASLKAIVTPLRRDESARKEVRHALTHETDNLVTEINKVLATARLKFAECKYKEGEHGYDDIVLIIDNLEKLRVHGDEKKAESLAYELFVRNAPSLTSLDSHIIFTVPLRAQYAFGSELSNAYGIAPFTMPMVAVEWRNRPGTPYLRGYTYLESMLDCRAQGYSLDALFTTDALKWLIGTSGGHIRSLMMLSQQAFSRTTTLPVDESTAKKATSQMLQLYARLATPQSLKKLAELYRAPNREIDTSDIEYRAMLEQLMILEYLNGTDKPEDLSESWYAVHPIVRKLSGFEAAVAEYDREHNTIARAL